MSRNGGRMALTAAASTDIYAAQSFAAAAADRPPVQLKHMDYYDSQDMATTTTATPVIWLHGLLGNKKNFASIATSLGQQLRTKRRLIGLDLRNHGTYIELN